MKKQVIWVGMAALLSGLLVGCTSVGEKSASLSAVYGVTAVVALLLLAGYCIFVKKKEIWFLLLFVGLLRHFLPG